MKDMPDWWCDCGEPDEALEVLKEILNTFDGTGNDYHFTSLEKLNEFDNKHGIGVSCLILYLLDHVGIIEHSGSVVSSAWLTFEGEKLKHKLTGN